MIVLVPLKPVNPKILHTELQAVGSGLLSLPQYAGGNRMALEVPDGSDPARVTGVVTAHVDSRTPGGRLADEALETDNTNAIHLRAMVMTISDIVNDIAARIIARQNPRTWSPQQIGDLVRTKIETLTSRQTVNNLRGDK